MYKYIFFSLYSVGRYWIWYSRGREVKPIKFSSFSDHRLQKSIRSFLNTEGMSIYLVYRKRPPPEKTAFWRLVSVSCSVSLAKHPEHYTCGPDFVSLQKKTLVPRTYIYMLMITAPQVYSVYTTTYRYFL